MHSQNAPIVAVSAHDCVIAYQKLHVLTELIAWEALFHAYVQPVGQVGITAYLGSAQTEAHGFVKACPSESHIPSA